MFEKATDDALNALESEIYDAQAVMPLPSHSDLLDEIANERWRRRRKGPSYEESYGYTVRL